MMMLDARLILRHHIIVLQSFNLRAISTKHFTTIVFFGGWRQNFEDDYGIEQYVTMLVVEFRFAANDHQIGIGIQPTQPGADFHVWGEPLTWFVSNLRSGDGYEIKTDSAMVGSLARHRVDDTVQKLMSGFRIALKPQVCFRTNNRQVLLWQSH